MTFEDWVEIEAQKYGCYPSFVELFLARDAWKVAYEAGYNQGHADGYKQGYFKGSNDAHDITKGKEG